uniref:Uncharacterized protein n=1 Tax=Melopsittacus undulatus TaxID=13146 RepID=A0A8V5G7E0_MELUD
MLEAAWARAAHLPPLTTPVLSPLSMSIFPPHHPLHAPPTSLTLSLSCRDPPDHIPSLLPPFMDPALPHAAGTARHRLPAPWLPQAHVPQHRLPAPWLPQAHVPQHRYRHTRGRRHTQLLRVGCVLGTCQVQNLSHRLWQLRGQLGRQDSSPMNPHSPHSYG